MEEAQFLKLYQFQQEILKLYFHSPENSTYSQRSLQLMDEILGYKKSFSGFLGNCPQKTFSPNVMINGLDTWYVQDFISELWHQSNTLQKMDDFIVLSQMKNYQKNSLYQKLMKPNKLGDCIIAFLKYPKNDNYLSYVVIFSENKPFEDVEIELLKFALQTFAIGFDNYLKAWNVQNEIKLLMNCTDYFPIGIMIVENLNNVTFTNVLAKEYLAELGYPDDKFYNAFYVNELYRYFQSDLLNFGESKPIRIKQFLFSIQSISNPGKNFSLLGQGWDEKGDFSMENYSSHYDDISTCIYIVNDQNYDTKVSNKTLEKIGMTNRERQVIDYLVQGLSNQEIAEKMFISVNTVKIHISNIFRKVEVRSRSELIDKLYKLERE